MVFRWSLIDSKSPQVSRTLLSILNNTLVWMASTRRLISQSSSSFTNPLVTVLRAPITIGIIITFMFHSLFVFLNSFARSRCVSIFSLSFNFTLWSVGTARFTILQVLFFVVAYYEVWPRLGDPFVSPNLRGVCASHFPRQMQGYAYTICSYGYYYYYFLENFPH